MTDTSITVSNAVPQNDAAPTPEAAAARAEINTLSGDRDFLARFASGDAQARQQMADLHVKGWPEASSDSAAQGPGAGPNADGAGVGDPADAGADGEPLDTSLPFQFAPDVPLDQVKETHRMAQEAVRGLGIEPEAAASAVKMLDNAINARPKGDDGQPVSMDQVELSKFEFILHERWGGDYETNCQSLAGALRKAGPRGGAFLQRALLAAGPQTAAAMVDNLVRRARAAQN